MRRIASYIVAAKNKFDLGMTWQAAQIMQTGKIAFKTVGGSVEVDDIDFECPTANFANSTTLKIADIEAHIKQIESSNNGIYKIDKLTFGIDALNKFLADEDNQKQLDNRRIDRGSFVFGETDMDGFAQVGVYNFNGKTVTMYTFDAYYTDDADATKSFIDTKKIVFLSSKGQYKRYHAGVTVVKEIDANLSPFVGGANNVTIVQDTVAIDMYMETDRVNNGDIDGVYLKTQSAPLMVPKTNNSFGCLTYTGA
jgi:glycyl-tRNA synthetase alpha subunit